MSRKKLKKHAPPQTPATEDRLLVDLSARRQKRYDLLIAFVLIVFGAYHSIIYFGHLAVPNPDFTGFLESARQFWSPGKADYFKRAPVLSFLQIPLGHLIGGPYPDLAGGWLLNALIHPFNLLLLWLVGRKIIGSAALWVTLAAMLNPQTIYLITEPICETLLLFFTLLTLYLMFRRSKWCYLFAAITTMVRYEGAALILAAFVLDCIYDRRRKKLILTILFSFLASVPLGLWLLAMKMNPGNAFYVENLSVDRLKNTPEILESLWQVTFSSLFIPSVSGGGKEAVETIFNLTKVLAVISFLFGAFYGLLRRRWEVLALLIFFVPYMVIHAMYTWSVPRFYASVHWIVLLICVLGLQGAWRFINQNNRVPRPIIVGAQAILLVIAVIWAGHLVRFLPKIKHISPPSNFLPLAIALILLALYFVRRFFYRNTFIWRDAVITIIVLAMLFSNQYMLVRTLGDGQYNIEFKRLAEWYIENAKPGEKMLCSMSNVVEIFAPQAKKCFIHPANIKAANPQEFAEICYKRNIDYVVWDSRIGRLPNDVNYKGWGIGNFAMLEKPRDIGPYEFIKTITCERYGRRLNIFRLRKLSDAVPKPETK
ncbi:MAG: hypothetical protein JW709_12415 [Sedimentisphaerales bacterium]|nr:hypothetical protein [Sedimentisphaerales bacterium]